MSALVRKRPFSSLFGEGFRTIQRLLSAKTVGLSLDPSRNTNTKASWSSEAMITECRNRSSATMIGTGGSAPLCIIGGRNYVYVSAMRLNIKRAPAMGAMAGASS
jgi:hypothetical protein